jgi:hypothetical protein
MNETQISIYWASADIFRLAHMSFYYKIVANLINLDYTYHKLHFPHHITVS